MDEMTTADIIIGLMSEAGIRELDSEPDTEYPVEDDDREVHMSEH